MEFREHREHIEAHESLILSQFATKSSLATRVFEIDKCPVRTDFQRDRDKIIHSKSFRRLMHKTQVFIAPEVDHYRTRLTHTMEVAQISRTISRALRLNEDLTEAIALGHDLGHTPFGHMGESALDGVMPNGFRHNEQSVRILSHLENDGQGLNLTNEVLNGIMNHQTGSKPSTLEGMVVQISDKIAYINHDIDDAIRAGQLTEASLPKQYTNVLGDSPAQRIDFLIKDILAESADQNFVKLSKTAYDALYGLRQHLFETLYESQLLQSERVKIKFMIESIFNYYIKYPDKLPPFFRNAVTTAGLEISVCDFIAGMSDRYAFRLFKELFVPETFV